MSQLEKSDILRGLTIVDERARSENILVDLSIYGGAAMVLAFDARQATRDVDAVVNGAPDFLRRIASEIAREEAWPDDWLNDGVKGFLSHHEQMMLMAAFPAGDGVGLRVHTPSPEYMFAMKCMAMRTEGLDGSRDISDIELLIGITELQDVETALRLVEAFYPAHLIPPKVRFGLEEIVGRILERRRSSW